ncbi:glycosyltransferase family 9 protein [bacterium]|nr:MAG: glycosyltransferase family 9 protein [bacterium]
MALPWRTSRPYRSRRRSFVPSDKRVLVPMKTFLGDAVMASPILPALEREFGQVVVWTDGVVDQLLWTPERDRQFIKMPRVRKPKEVIAQARRLRAERFDVAVVVNHSFRAALTCLLAGIKVRVGHTVEQRRIVLTHPVDYDETRWETRANFDLLKRLGVDAEETIPQLPMTGQEREEGVRALEGATVGLQPGARFDAKQLPPPVREKILQELLAEGHRVALLGGKEEADRALPLVEKYGSGVVNLVGKTSIRQTLGALAGLRLMLGADTGLLHMAAAVDTPTVTVFGPTPASKWGHWYEPHTVLQASEGKIENADAEEILRHARERLTR